MFFNKNKVCLDCGQKASALYHSDLMRGEVCRKCKNNEIFAKKVFSSIDKKYKKGEVQK